MKKNQSFVVEEFYKEVELEMRKQILTMLFIKLIKATNLDK
jgi:hypothetical protein